jgi:threonylcarbamoyladenosine tRNA methylthiotransferase MtaB
MKDHLPPPVKRERLERLLGIANRSSEASRRSYVGRTFPVLWEQRSDGLWAGLTPNYVRAYSDADAPLENRILPARLVGLHGEGMLSVMEASSNP